MQGTLHIRQGAIVSQPIRTVEIVSDGILVAFSGGTHCYFSAEFLLSQMGIGSNQVFLTYDQAAIPPLTAGAGESLGQSLMS